MKPKEQYADLADLMPPGMFGQPMGDPSTGSGAGGSATRLSPGESQPFSSWGGSGAQGGIMSRLQGYFGGMGFGGGGDATGIGGANAANQNRLNQIMMMLNSMGTSERMRIRSDTAGQLAAGQQQAINRGLGASTVLSAMARRSQESGDYRLQRLADMLTSRRVGAVQSVTNRPLPLSDFLRFADAQGYSEAG
jgi:hypothetical protein